MTVSVNLNSQIGIELASRLGLELNRREGHDLAGPCITCKSSDAFRLHQQTGVAQCYSCGGKWSPFQVAETVLRDRERAKDLLVEMGVFQPADARQPDGWEEAKQEEAAPAVASAEISLPEGEPLKLEVSPAGREPQRLVVAIRGEMEHRDRLNTDSSTSRERFIKKLAAKLGVERDVLAPLIDAQLIKLADEIDEKNPAPEPGDPGREHGRRLGTLAHPGQGSLRDDHGGQPQGTLAGAFADVQALRGKGILRRTRQGHELRGAGGGGESSGSQGALRGRRLDATRP
jgi:hypothetical protein